MYSTKTKSNIKSKRFYILMICAIITIVILCKVFATDLAFNFKSITYAGKEYKPMTDALAFHFSVVDYDAKDGDDKEVSLHGPLIEATNVKMQGYGRYHMQLQFNLVGFIEYCHSKFPEVIEPILGPIQGDDYNAKINKLKSSLASGTTKDVLNNFWSTMSSGAYNFDRLQDEFIIRSYIIPAIGKLSLTNSRYYKAFKDEGSFSMSVDDVTSDDGELVTALLSSVYSDFNTADLTSASSISIKSGDLVPFLYNVDETSDDPNQIAKFAYIAYIYGFDTVGRTDGFHYWEQEFEAVFPGKSYDLSDEDLNKYQRKYDTMAEILSEEKGDKGSRLLGQTITTIIKSDYNIETQVSAVRAKIDNILSGFNMDVTYKELIAKNYLMVKHMMDNDHIKDTIKDYEIGTIFRNETSLSQGQVDENDTNTVLLADFQLVTLKGKNVKEGRDQDYDVDGVFDGEEIGPEPSIFNTWTDITSVVKAAKSIDGTGGDITMEEAKYWETFNDSIKVEWEDVAKTKVKKVLAKLYNYRSNPNLKDTDFDGLSDLEEKGKLPLTNNFKGSSMTTDDGNLNVDYNIDFRYLMFDNKKYNDELAQHSLIMSNLADGKAITLQQGTQNYGTFDIITYMQKLGFENILTPDRYWYYDEGYIINQYIGYKTIDYYGKKRGVVGVFLGGLSNEDAYKKLVVNADKLSGTSVYTEIANKVISYINDSKLNEFKDYDLGYCYWVAGKGIAGGVASEVATNLDDTNDIYCYTFGAPKTRKDSNEGSESFIKNIINEDDIITKIYQDGYIIRGEKYNASIMSDFIYNYRNLTKNNPKYTGNYQKVNTVLEEIPKFKVMDADTINKFKEEWAGILTYSIGYNNSCNKIFKKQWGNNIYNDIVDTINKNISNDELRTASSVKAYWTLAKCLEGLDNSKTNGRTYKKTIEQANSEMWDYEKTDADKEYEENIATLLKCIKEVGEAYIENVYTYSAGKTLSYNSLDSNGNVIENPKANDSTIKYSIEDRIAKNTTNDVEVTDAIFDVDKRMKTSSISAYNVWNEYKENIIDSNIGITKDNIKSRKIMMQGADTDTTIALHHLGLFDEYIERNSSETLKFNFKRYNYDENNNRVYIGNANKRNYVADDCSGFAAAVYYYYLNKIKKEKNGGGIDLWTTGSKKFIDKNSVIGKILEDNSFKVYRWDEINKDKDKEYNIYIDTDFKLLPGDLLYRAPQNGKTAHVEFYLENDDKEPFSFGWGDIQSSFENNKNSKTFEIIRDVDNYNLLTENAIKVETGNINYKLKSGQNATTGDKYKIVGKPGIYNTVRSFYDYNCRYDYVIRLVKKE